MKILLIAYILGVLSEGVNKDIFIILISLILVALLILNFKEKTLIVIVVAIIFFSGFMYTKYTKRDILTPYIEYKDKVELEGVITSEMGKGYVLRTNGDKILFYTETTYEIGDRIRCVLSVNSPTKAKNPFAFDMEEYYLHKGISLIGFSDKDSFICKDTNLFINIKRLALKVRESFLNKLDNIYGSEHKGLIQGILIGETDNILEETKQSFKDTGVSHLMAVSGANLAYFLLPFYLIVNRLIKKEWIRALILVFPVLFFVMIAGMGTSILRAGIMVLICFFIKVFKFKKDTVNILCVTALIMLVYFPYYIYDIGFQLSFIATFGIVTLEPKFEKMKVICKLPRVIRGGICVTLAAQIAVLGVSIYHFNQLSLVCVFVNLILVPLTELVTILGFFSIGIQKLVFINDKLMDVFIYILSFFSNIPFASISLPSMMFVGLVSYYMIIFLIYRASNKVDIWLVILTAIFLISWIPNFHFNRFEVNVLSSGNGDSIFVRTKGNMNILIDGGNDKIEFGKYGLVPYLKKRGVLNIDLMFVTHSHADHLKELFDVINEIKVKAIFIPYIRGGMREDFDQLIQVAKDKDISVHFLKRDDIIRVDEMTTINVLHPKLETDSLNANNYSLVCMLKYKELSVLLTGDMEKEDEDSMIPYLEHCDVLKVAHHGSLTSSQLRFIYGLMPKISIVSCGKNQYGHPSQKVLERLEVFGETKRTDLNGCVKIYEYKNKFYLHCELEGN